MSIIPFIGEDDDDMVAEPEVGEQVLEQSDPPPEPEDTDGANEEEHHHQHSVGQRLEEFDDQFTEMENDLVTIRNDIESLQSEDDVLANRITNLNDDVNNLESQMQDLLGIYDAVATKVNPLFGGGLRSLIPELDEDSLEAKNTFELKDAEEHDEEHNEEEHHEGHEEKEEFVWQRDKVEGSDEHHDEEHHDEDEHHEEHHEEHHDEGHHDEEHHDEDEHHEEHHDEEHHDEDEHHEDHHEEHHDEDEHHEQKHHNQTEQHDTQMHSNVNQRAVEQDYEVEKISGTVREEVLMLHWMDQLIDEIGFRGTIRTIDYYRRIGWISPNIQNELVRRLYVLDDVDMGKRTYRFKISTEVHEMSQNYIKRISQ